MDDWGKVTKRKLRDDRGEVFATVVLTEESPGSYPRHIDVSMNGTSLGTLVYVVQRYNLRRVIVAKTWTPTTAAGEKLTGWDTQKKALGKLFEHLGMSVAAEAVLR